jgi:chaperonin cofactor prefoldin
MFQKIRKLTGEFFGKLKKIDVKEAEQLQDQAEVVAEKIKTVQKQIKEKDVELKDVVEAKNESKKFLDVFKRSTK